MSRTTRRYSRLELLQLEGRCLMAGNVTASVSGGVLTVTGDDLGNSVELIQTGPNTVEVRGTETTVNGGPAPFVATGVRDVYASLNGGDDGVGLALRVPRNLVVRLGDGDDAVSLGGYFETPPGLYLPDPRFAVDVGGNLLLDGGAGNDFVGVTSSRVAANAAVFTGLGDDFVSVSESTFLDGVAVAAGAGNDFLGLFYSTFSGELAADMGAGDDSTSLFESTFNDDVVLRGGAGVDDLFLSGNQFRDDLEVSGYETVTRE